MFSTFRRRFILGIYIFVLLSVPMGSYLVSQNQNIKSKAAREQTTTITKATPRPATSSAKDLLSTSKFNLTSEPDNAPAPSSASVATSFGPTLKFKANLEGRKDDESTKMFVGIMEGQVVNNPKFLLTFTVDLPASGEYSNLSLAGLTSGSKYTALLKGSAQIATSSAFIMSPAVTNLNSGQTINLLTGDLNDDNTVNAADYSIAQKALGSNPSSTNWNANADFNKDGTVNILDLSIITKNMGKIGDSGIWISPVPKVTSTSAAISQPAIGSPSEAEGYWLWIPK